MKINTKWIRDLNARPETIKLLVENIGETLGTLDLAKKFFKYMTQKAATIQRN